MDLFDLGVTLLNSENGNCALGKKKVDLRCCLLVSSPKKHFGPATFCFTVSVFCDFPPRLWVGCLLTKDTGRRKWIARKSWAHSGYMERAKKRTTCRGLREDVKCGKQREAVLKKGVETNSWGQNESHPREHNHLRGQDWDSFFSSCVWIRPTGIFYRPNSRDSGAT